MGRTTYDQIFGALLRYWPVVNSPKELMFLSEVEELLAVAKVLPRPPAPPPTSARPRTE
jgi:hypothetical protein